MTEPLCADDEVRYHGQVVAVVVGRSLRACRAAAAAVEVEYEPLPPLLGIREAIAKGSFHTPPHTIARGDWKSALARSPLRLDGDRPRGLEERPGAVAAQARRRVLRRGAGAFLPGDAG